MLSIIIPHFNQVSKLARLIKSIPNKECIEVLVVDDRSDISFDLLYRQVVEFNSVYNFTIELLINNGNKGAGACRNIGLEKAMGKWVLFADADDYFLDQAFNKIEPYLMSDLDVIFFTPTSIIDGTNEESDRHIVYEKLIEDYYILKNKESEIKLRYQFVVPWSKLIRREILMENNISFDEVIASNDIMFSTKLGYAMKDFRVSKDNIYCVTRGYGSLTVNISKSVFEARLGVFINQYNFCKKVLTKNDISNLNFKGVGYLVNCIKYNLGLECFIKTLLIMVFNRIQLIKLSDLRPQNIIKKIKHHFLNDKLINFYIK